MHTRIFMAGKADVANLAGLASLCESGVCSFIVKDAMRVFVPENFMMLDQVDTVHLQTLERFIQLPGRLLLRTPIDFRHDKRLIPVAITKCRTHANLTGAIVVIPTVVEKVDALIYRRPNNTDGELFINVRKPEMPASNPNGRHLFPCAAKCSINHW